ncbi:hypothetical protein [Spelaeicoccus albus]|nr:hypothetical protein [Spelaeicoccus albus]
MTVQKYKIGDEVGVTEGPMQGIFGIVVGFYKKRNQYIVRFSGVQQAYYDESQLYPWHWKNKTEREVKRQ